MLGIRRCKCVIAIGAAGVNYTEFDSNILIFDYAEMGMNCTYWSISLHCRSHTTHLVSMPSSSSLS